MDRTPEADRTSAAASASSAFSASPDVQESPFSNFLSNLSPINTATTVSYTQRSFGINLPTSPAVFTSPHANLLRQTSFVDRHRDDTVEAGLGVYKECNTSIVQKAKSEEVQFCSPLGCVDEYLADPAEAYSKNPVDLHLQPTNEVCQSMHTGLAPVKESITEVHDVVVGSTENEALALTHEAEKDLPSSSLGMSEAEINQKSGRTTRADMNADLAYRAQDRGENTAKLQTSGRQYDEQNGRVQSYEDSNMNKRKVLKGLVEEGGQNQRCIRRHLQFEAGKVFKHSILGNSERPCSLTPHSITNLKSLASHSDHRASSSPQVVSCATSKFLSYPYESVRSTQIDVSSNTSASIHSGIGLHLNHIARATPMSLDIFASNKSIGYSFIPDQMLEHDYSKNIAKHSSTSAVSGEAYSLVASGQQESQSVTEASSFTFHSTGNKKPLCDSMNMVLVGQGAASCEASMSASPYAAKVEELNQLSPRSNRRKAASMIEECKRCNCKRSKCLKLYCECFAAGVYCLDSCACENCYNKPEFEDTVLDVRQQIESRNPLAFTPKVVDNAIDCSANLKEEPNMTTPSSARHKRGCNCKKSKCLKKYCECYQAEVGCSSACRCEGCKNKFGNKAERLYNKAWETHLAEKIDAAKGVECMRAASISHYSPTREGRSNINTFTPLSHPSSNTTMSSASSTRRSSAKVRQAQIPSRKLQPSSTGRLHWGSSPAIVTPQLPERKGPQELQSDGASYDMPDDDTPEVLKEISNHTKIVKASSPNKKRVSPLQSRLQLRSSSPTGSRSGRKFTLHAVPSFPPLTPYRNSKEDIHETGNDDNVTSKNTWTTHMNLDEV